jgi:hypothetical protein
MKDAQDLTHEQLVALVNQIREAISWPLPKCEPTAHRRPFADSAS